jgi:hypothetical protein
MMNRTGAVSSEQNRYQCHVSSAKVLWRCTTGSRNKFLLFQLEFTMKLCSLFFYLKALLAIGISVFLIGFQVYQVYNKYVTSVKPLKSIDIPDSNSADASKCYFTSTSKARLEPPEGAFFFGFSVDWAVDTPKKLQTRLNSFPSLIK